MLGTNRHELNGKCLKCIINGNTMSRASALAFKNVKMLIVKVGIVCFLNAAVFSHHPSIYMLKEGRLKKCVCPKAVGRLVRRTTKQVYNCRKTTVTDLFQTNAARLLQVIYCRVAFMEQANYLFTRVLYKKSVSPMCVSSSFLSNRGVPSVF
jgi:hypothetical protein